MQECRRKKKKARNKHTQTRTHLELLQLGFDHIIEAHVGIARLTPGGDLLRRAGSINTHLKLRESPIYRIAQHNNNFRPWADIKHSIDNKMRV